MRHSLVALIVIGLTVQSWLSLTARERQIYIAGWLEASIVLGVQCPNPLPDSATIVRETDAIIAESNLSVGTVAGVPLSVALQRLGCKGYPRR